MILATTPTIEGKPISVYMGVIGAEIIFGANFLKDWMAEGADFWGGRNSTYEKIYEDARTKALEALEAKASARGANGIVGIRFEYQVMGATNGMLMVAATGTAVSIPESAAERQREAELEAIHFIDVAGQRRGPFSVVQLRELNAKAKLDPIAPTFTEDGATGQLLGQLISTDGRRL